MFGFLWFVFFFFREVFAHNSPELLCQESRTFATDSFT